MFFNETSRSHQSTPLNSPHTGRQRKSGKSETEKARAKEQWPQCAWVGVGEREREKVKDRNDTSMASSTPWRSSKVHETSHYSKHFISHFHTQKKITDLLASQLILHVCTNTERRAQRELGWNYSSVWQWRLFEIRLLLKWHQQKHAPSCDVTWDKLPGVDSTRGSCSYRSLVYFCWSKMCFPLTKKAFQCVWNSGKTIPLCGR